MTDLINYMAPGIKLLLGEWGLFQNIWGEITRLCLWGFSFYLQINNKKIVSSSKVMIRGSFHASKSGILIIILNFRDSMDYIFVFLQFTT